MPIRQPIKVNSWQFYVCMALFVFIAWFGLSRGIEILDTGILSYAKKGFPARTASPTHNSFAFYYQVLFHLALGMFGTLVAITLGLAGYSHATNQAQKFQPIGKAFFYTALPFGILWFALHTLRYWVI